MDAWTEIAFSAFGLSVLVSAVQIGKWALHANPRALANAAGWSTAALAALAAAALTWLVVQGRWTQAMMLAAFVMPVVVQSLPRWRALFRQLDLRRRLRPKTKLDLSGGSPAGTVDADLVRQSLMVLTRYLDQVKEAAEYRAVVPRLGNGSSRSHMRMPAGEALAILGLEPGARAEEICAAHRRLQQRLDPELGGTRYLATKIDEAREVLLDHG
ncbi:MAG TPA: hypothetical protein VFQ82_01060 [Stellaceae bacterium]|jgi:hypothetical protein|nr:hypothetical protein [Stellaceae bacterium]